MITRDLLDLSWSPDPELNSDLLFGWPFQTPSCPFSTIGITSHLRTIRASPGAWTCSNGQACALLVPRLGGSIDRSLDLLLVPDHFRSLGSFGGALDASSVPLQCLDETRCHLVLFLCEQWIVSASSCRLVVVHTSLFLISPSRFVVRRLVCALVAVSRLASISCRVVGACRRFSFPWNSASSSVLLSELYLGALLAQSSSNALDPSVSCDSRVGQ